MHPYISPRLPAVPVLGLDATGPEFSRWRRSVKYALETKGTWKYCDGSCPMPMPGAVSEEVSKGSVEDDGPSLLEERRAWVRYDREAKLDIFLSLSEDVMLEVFEVGPPLPPTSLSAHDMMKTLAEQFATFNFEAYHHAFCHFLNLHIDQYETLEDFNKEFSTTLEDLLDHGHALSNVQACSAYFSKLRCTQNPWVVNMLEQWDQRSPEPLLQDLLQETPPWSIIRPLATKSSKHNHGDVVIQDSAVHTDSDSRSEPSTQSTPWSSKTHSRHTSSTTMQSQDIIIYREDKGLANVDSRETDTTLKALPLVTRPKRSSTESNVTQPDDTTRKDSDSAVSDWLEKRQLPPRRSLTIPTHRPLPALPHSPSLAPPTPEHPALRHKTKSNEQLFANIHPNMRPSSPVVRPSTASSSTRNCPPSSPFPPFDSPEINISNLPWPSISDDPEDLSPSPPPPPPPSHHFHHSPPQVRHTRRTYSTESAPTIRNSTGSSHSAHTSPSSANSSLISLPLQGTATTTTTTSMQDAAWDYLYKAHDQSASQSSSPAIGTPSATALPPSHYRGPTSSPATPTPTTTTTTTTTTRNTTEERISADTAPAPAKLRKVRSKTLSISHLAKFGNDGSGSDSGGGGSSMSVWERSEKKKKVWSLGRFGHGKGVKEMI